MLKKLFTFFIAILLFVFGVGKAHAQEQFRVDANVKYDVNSSGQTDVTHNISLENLFSTLYATTYTLSLVNINAQNISAHDENGSSLPFEVQSQNDKTEVKINFPDAVVGKGSKRNFSISYQSDQLAVKTGEVWEVSIPKLSQESSFDNYYVTLNVPSSFGLEAYVSPKPSSSTENSEGKTYIFDKDSITKTGITAGFGQFQVFTFNISYHLENPLAKSATTQIALPPDTAFQKIYLSKLDPKPETVETDPDGNWLATYRLNAHQRVDIVATGAVQIFASYRPFPKPNPQILNDNLKETEFWQVNDQSIQKLASELRTPRAIYDYVSKNLKYDFARVQPNVQRLGAKGALENPSMAICMEFTDLFVAIARAAGIPAREVNGYAYTENPDLQPLSLVADVLHSWPEYYDADVGAWIPVDPTWGSTTGGVDYFDKLDLRHFAFVIHGENSTKPYPPGSYKLGANPQKDVFVSFGKLPDSRNSIPVLTAETTPAIPFLGSKYSLKIYNPGPTALYSLYPTIYFDGKENSRDYIESLPPYSSYMLPINVPFSLLGKDTPQSVKVQVNATQIEIPSNKNQIIIISLIFLFVVFLLLMLLLLIKLKKINLGKITAKIGYLKQNTYGKVTQIFKKNSEGPGTG